MISRAEGLCTFKYLCTEEGQHSAWKSAVWHRNKHRTIFSPVDPETVQPQGVVLEVTFMFVTISMIIERGHLVMEIPEPLIQGPIVEWEVQGHPLPELSESRWLTQYLPGNGFTHIHTHLSPHTTHLETCWFRHAAVRLSAYKFSTKTEHAACLYGYSSVPVPNVSPKETMHSMFLFLRHFLYDYSICKLALTVNIITCCFTIQTSGLVRQLPTRNNEARHQGAILFCSTNKKEDCQPHFIVLSRQTRSLKRETTG